MSKKSKKRLSRKEQKAFEDSLKRSFIEAHEIMNGTRKSKINFFEYFNLEQLK